MRFVEPSESVPRDPVRYRGKTPGWLDEWRFNRAGRYRDLSCGHVTTVETQERFSLWRPCTGVWYCFTCEQWVTLAPKKVAVVLPDVPPF